jgi:plasmid stabilization system protein ParE
MERGEAESREVILFRPAAARELAADVRYYDEHYAGRGQRFAQSVERTLALIAEFPLAFAVLYEPDIRSAKVARFPYRVVYLVVGSTIDVLAVAHAKRRTGYWRDRLG